jgi:hypothetical protein
VKYTLQGLLKFCVVAQGQEALVGAGLGEALQGLVHQDGLHEILLGLVKQVQALF